MTDLAIRVENLSKLYHIGRARQRHDTLRDALVSTFQRSNVPTFQRSNVQPDDTLWALRDVSFEVQRGEVVGVIGRNGAGKSTLLKILSRITEPTSGRAEIHGRVGSLLEVGTGFHPELTGRENIYLNGAILGMKRAEIGRKFDEIVAFAEIERFLDTPVKRYSSGMYVRLAFAVAAHLEPEILLVDEVLAVGDASFQKKCLGKMGDVAKEGRTVLFVSHNMGAIAALCQNAVLLHHGQISLIGSASVVVGTYLEEGASIGRVEFTGHDPNILQNGEHQVSFIETRNSKKVVTSTFAYGETISVRVGILGATNKNIIVGIGVRDIYGNQILHFNNKDDGVSLILKQTTSIIEMSFQNILNSGTYYVAVWIGNTQLTTEVYIRDCLRFVVDEASVGLSLAKGAVIQPAYWLSD